MSQPQGLAVAACRLLGTASYGIYVLHAPTYLLLSEASLYLNEARVTDFDAWGALVFTVGLVCLCLALDRFYDAPLRAFVAKRLRRMKVVGTGR